MSELLQVFFMSMVPLGELRLSIPIGLLVYKLGVFEVVLVSIIGNSIPILLVLLFLEKFLHFFTGKWKLFDITFEWWKKRAEANSDLIKKYGTVGLAIFIGIPFPMTGAWTGALLAVLMNLPLKNAFIAVISGVTIAAVIVAGVVLTGMNIEEFFGINTLLGIIVSIAVIYLFFTKHKNKTKKI